MFIRLNKSRILIWCIFTQNIVILEYNSSLADLIFLFILALVWAKLSFWDFGATVFVMIVFNLRLSVLILYMCNLKG